MTEPATPEAKTTDESRPAGESPTAQQSAAPRAPEAGAPPSSTDRKSIPTERATRGRRSLGLGLWMLIIATVLTVELFIYGHDGWVRVCVGLEGVTDLSAVDRPRDRDSVRGFPICSEQLNLGMYSRSEDSAREALDVACARGATLLRGNKADCLRRDHGWIRRVDKENIAPWDPRLYRRLLFLD